MPKFTQIKDGKTHTVYIPPRNRAERRAEIAEGKEPRRFNKLRRFARRGVL